MEESLFFYRREPVCERCLNINYQPSFSDALTIIGPLPTIPYQRVPLRSNTTLSFYHIENNIKKPIHYLFNLNNGYIQVKKTERRADPRYLSCFLIKEGNKVSYMLYPHTNETPAKIKKQPPGLDEDKTSEG